MSESNPPTPKSKPSSGKPAEEFTAQSQRRAGAVKKSPAAPANRRARDAPPDSDERAELWRDPNVTGGRRG